MLPSPLRASALLALLTLAASAVSARAEAPTGARAELAPGSAVGLSVSLDERVEASALTETGRVSLRLDNRGDTTREAELTLTLPEGAVVGRLALLVDTTWVEAEVLPRSAAARIYRDIVHPRAAPPRDPALLAWREDGVWSLSVFPVPAGGARSVELVWHRLRVAPKAVEVERSISATGASRTIIAAPLAPPRPAPLGPLVVALDTSFSLGPVGFARAVTLARELLATPGARLVIGDLGARACPEIEACLGVSPGGATDLTALLGAARALGPARIALITDGHPTAGETGAALLRARAEVPVEVHAIDGIRGRDRVVLEALGQLTPAILVRRGALSEPVVSWVGGAPVLLGALGSPEVEVEVRWPGHAEGQRLTLGGARARSGYTLARLWGAALVEQRRLALDTPAEGLARLAREHGVAGRYGSLLALESEGDFAARGIARMKGAERLRELGQAPPPLSPADIEAEDALRRDGDGDGLADELDACPSEPETVNGFEDSDGCPDTPRVLIRASDLRVSVRPYFPSNQATLGRESQALLDELARVLADHPEIELVEVAGHCDTREARPLKLGARRAEAVTAALIARGVVPSRLIGASYGAERPIAPNDQAQDRARNRRVELVILKVAGDVVGPSAQLRGHLDRLLAAAKTPAARVAAFDHGLAEAFPEDFAATALAALREPGTDLDPTLPGADPVGFWTAVAARLGPADRETVGPLAARWLATRTPAVRLGSTRASLDAEAALLRLLGDEAEATRRASEQAELGL